MNPVCDDSRASNGWIAGRPRLCSFVFCASFAGRSRRLARKASLRAPITIVAAPSPSPVIARTILSSREREIDEMHAQAHKLGYFCRPASVYLQDLATRIAMHLKNRLGTMVYQTVGFSMENFPLELAYHRPSRWPPCSRRRHRGPRRGASRPWTRPTSCLAPSSRSSTRSASARPSHSSPPPNPSFECWRRSFRARRSRM